MFIYFITKNHHINELFPAVRQSAEALSLLLVGPGSILGLGFGGGLPLSFLCFKKI